MAFYASLHELVEKDARSKALYNRLPPDVQTALQEQRQNIHTHADLERVEQGFQKRQHSR